MKGNIKCVTLMLFCIIGIQKNVFSQIDSLSNKKVRTPLSVPAKATILSAVLPGAGQVYNKKYLKSGVVWAGFAGIGASYVFNQSEMKKYQLAYNARIDGDSNTSDNIFPLLTDNAVLANRNFYRRWRDVSILGLIAFYAVQVIDANVDAHLKEFDINKDLALQVRPSVANIGLYSSPSFGLVVTLTLK